MRRALFVALALALAACSTKPPAPITAADFGAKQESYPIAPAQFSAASACRQWTKAELVALANQLAPLDALSPAWLMEHEWQRLRDAASCPSAK